MRALILIAIAILTLGLAASTQAGQNCTTFCNRDHTQCQTWCN